jgi:hypothetical protein
VTNLEDRLRDAFDAAAQTVRPEVIRSPPARRRRTRLPHGMLVPLTAAASVAVILAAVFALPSLVSGRARPAPRASTSPQRPAPAGGLPRFFAGVPLAGVGAGPVQIRDAATGKLAAQDASTFGTTAVAAQPDDRHFVIAKLSGSGCLSRFYRFDVNSQGQPGRLQPLPIPAVHGTVLGMAASADGRTLAYALMGCGKGTPSYLGVADARTGRIRQWGGVNIDGEGQGSAIVASDVSVTADGRFLAYHLTTPNGGWTTIMVLPTNSAPGNAVQRSRAAASYGPASRVLASGLLCLAGHTADAYTLSGTATVQRPATGPRLTLAQYSTTTGRRLRVLGGLPSLPVNGPGCFLSPNRSGRYLLERAVPLPSSSRTVAVLQLTRVDLLTREVSTLTVTTPSGQMSSTVSGMITAW